MKTQKQAASTTARNQLGRFIGSKRKLLCLCKRKHDKYTVKTFQREMTQAEHLEWHVSIHRLLDPILRPEKYGKRRQQLLKNLAAKMAKDRE